MPAAGDRDRTARRRAAIRRHHPDAGGTAAELVAALDALGTPRPAVGVTRTWRGRFRRIVRRATGRRRRSRNLQ